MTQDVWQGELEQTHRDGYQIVVSSRWALRRDWDGRPTGYLEINRDIRRRSALSDPGTSSPDGYLSPRTTSGEG